MIDPDDDSEADDELQDPELERQAKKDDQAYEDWLNREMGV